MRTDAEYKGDRVKVTLTFDLTEECDRSVELVIKGEEVGDGLVTTVDEVYQHLHHNLCGCGRPDGSLTNIGGGTD